MNPIFFQLKWCDMRYNNHFRKQLLGKNILLCQVYSNSDIDLFLVPGWAKN